MFSFKNPKEFYQKMILHKIHIKVANKLYIASL